MDKLHMKRDASTAWGVKHALYIFTNALIDVLILKN